MNLGISANPALSNKIIHRSVIKTGENEMSIQGTANKSGLLILLVLFGAAYTWQVYFSAFPMEAGLAAVRGWMIGGGLGGFALALITVFKKSWTPVTAPVYAILQGLFLGAVSAFFESRTSGIVFQSVGLTFGTFLMLLFLYKTRIIKVTRKFQMGVVAATGAIALIYLFSFLFQFLGSNIFGFIHGNEPIGIAVSVIIVIIVALNLVLDFNFIEQGSRSGLPKYMERYASFWFTNHPGLAVYRNT